jgi:hypothetical protein
VPIPIAAKKAGFTCSMSRVERNKAKGRMTQTYGYIVDLGPNRSIMRTFIKNIPSALNVLFTVENLFELAQNEKRANKPYPAIDTTGAIALN